MRKNFKELKIRKTYINLYDDDLFDEDKNDT